ncbi:MAG: hypothetical protein C0402_14955 [Thermodesulfovibrio sp.]|nr:hypothetical protein [Thermodesulfovibrio sp.]
MRSDLLPSLLLFTVMFCQILHDYSALFGRDRGSSTYHDSDGIVPILTGLAYGRKMAGIMTECALLLQKLNARPCSKSEFRLSRSNAPTPQK